MKKKELEEILKLKETDDAKLLVVQASANEIKKIMKEENIDTVDQWLFYSDLGEDQHTGDKLAYAYTRHIFYERCNLNIAQVVDILDDEGEPKFNVLRTMGVEFDCLVEDVKVYWCFDLMPTQRYDEIIKKYDVVVNKKTEYIKQQFLNKKTVYLNMNDRMEKYTSMWLNSEYTRFGCVQYPNRFKCAETEKYEVTEFSVLPIFEEYFNAAKQNAENYYRRLTGDLKQKQRDAEFIRAAKCKAEFGSAEGPSFNNHEMSFMLKMKQAQQEYIVNLFTPLGVLALRMINGQMFLVSPAVGIVLMEGNRPDDVDIEIEQNTESLAQIEAILNAYNLGVSNFHLTEEAEEWLV